MPLSKVIQKSDVTNLDILFSGPLPANPSDALLKDKFVSSDKEELPIEDSGNNSDAYFALKSLGFKSNNINDVIRKIQKDKLDISTEDLIKESLKKLR